MSPLNVKETEFESPVMKDEKEKICILFKNNNIFIIFYLFILNIVSAKDEKFLFDTKSISKEEKSQKKM